MTKFQRRQLRAYKHGQSAYELGAEAAIDGHKITECPFGDGRILPWKNGFRDWEG